MRTILTFILALLMLALPAQAAIQIGQPAPTLIVRQLDGRNFDLALLKGKVVLVHFWATWCAPCKQEMPALNSFYQNYHPRGVEMVALSIDSNRQRSDVQKAMGAFSFPAAMLHDADANEFRMPEAIPVTYIIDAQGILRAKLTPDEAVLTEKTLEDAIKPIIE